MLVSRASASVPRRVSVAVALALGVLVAAGCQSNPKPPPLETASKSTSPSPSASPTEAAPTLPPEAMGTSEAAAKAFVRHWVEVLNYAGPAGDTEALRRLSAPDCAACTAIAKFIEEVKGAGGDIQGEGWTVRSAEVVSKRSGRTAVLDVQTVVHEQHVRTSRTADMKTFRGGKRLKTFWLRAQGSSWIVTRLDQPE